MSNYNHGQKGKPSMLDAGLHTPRTMKTFVSQYYTKTLTLAVTIPLFVETPHTTQLNNTDLPLALLLSILTLPLLLLLPLLQRVLLLLLTTTTNITTAVDWKQMASYDNPNYHTAVIKKALTWLLLPLYGTDVRAAVKYQCYLAVDTKRQLKNYISEHYQVSGRSTCALHTPQKYCWKILRRKHAFWPSL